MSEVADAALANAVTSEVTTVTTARARRPRALRDTTEQR